LIFDEIEKDFRKYSYRIAKREREFMSGDIKQEVANILNIPNTDAWDIVSSDPDRHLYLIHYSSEANLAKYGWLRGIVIDLSARAIVCQSYGYTPTVNASSLKVSYDGCIHLTDLNRAEYKLDPNKIQIKYGFEGTIIRIFKHNGIVYRTTHRRLDISRSRWGSSKTFLEMYKELKGPTDEMLFNPQSRYSPYCHIFLMVHPDVLIVSKQMIGPGYMVYLGYKKLWSLDPKECPYKQTGPNGELPSGVTQEEFDLDPRPNAGWIDPDVRVPPTVKELPERIMEPVLYSPSPISLEMANYHLRFGFYKEFDDSTLDPRLGTGEFVIIYCFDDEGNISSLLKVQSKAYEWRCGMRNNEPNLRYRQFQLLDGSYARTETREGYQDFVSRYPLMTPYPYEEVVKSIQTKGPFIVWPQRNVRVPLETQSDRYYNIWLGFLMAIPLHRQYDVVNEYAQIMKDWEDVYKWLVSLEEQNDIDSLPIPERARNLIEASRKVARDKNNRGKNISRSGQKLTVSDLTHRQIYTYLSRENGASLYRLVRDHRAFEQEQEKAKEVDQVAESIKTEQMKQGNPEPLEPLT
jgi:hypothetical protein